MNLIQSLIIIYAIICIGVVAGRAKVFNETQIEGFELFLFKIAIPCYLFYAILTHDFASLVNMQYVYSYLLSFLVVGLITCIIFFKQDSLSTVSIKILSSSYVNAAIYVLPVITFLLGDPKAGILGNLIQVVIIQPVFIILLSFIKHREKSISHRLFKSFSNPMVAAPIAAIGLNYFQIDPTIVVRSVTQYLGNSANGMALFALGLNLSTIKLSKVNLNKDVLLITIAKNILHPLVAVLIGLYIFRLETYWFYSLLIASSAPTAFVVYIIAKQYSTHADFVKVIVAATSFISLIMLVIISQYIH